MFELSKLVRSHVLKVKPYSTARDEYSGSSGIFLDANENPFGSITEESFNRYPDPYQVRLKRKIAEIKSINQGNIFLGNGSDEVVDLLFRLLCNPGEDQVIIMPPTYGMYEVSASINNVHLKKIPLTPEYQIDINAVMAAIDQKTKIIWVCSPNNPTGNVLNPDHIREITENFSGIVAIDEAYIDFSPYKSFTEQLHQYPNLCVIQTFSKAWGLASLRLGMAFASEDLVRFLNIIKPPYNINGLTQSTIFKALDNVESKNKMVIDILDQKIRLTEELEKLKVVEIIFPSDANFLLVKVKGGRKVYNYLVQQGVIVRDRSMVKFCEESLRITVGTEKENAFLIKKLKDY
ncbi:histidinol-phosphate transaminase [soil metagenome]